MEQRLRDIRNFALYYGQGETRALSQFDLVIVEPSHITPTDLQTLQRKGTKVLAYVSVMEVSPYHEQFADADVSDFIILPDGQRLTQPQYETFIMDMQSSHWKGMVLRQIGELLTKLNYDGVLLDTIGDVEMPNLPNAWAQIDAAAKFVLDLRRWFPKSILIQNNGLEVLCLQTAVALDGLLWENAPLGRKDSEAWIARVNDRLTNLHKTHGVRPMLLFDGVEKMPRREWIIRRRFADENEYLMYMAQSHYQGVVGHFEPQS